MILPDLICVECAKFEVTREVWHRMQRSVANRAQSSACWKGLGAFVLSFLHSGPCDMSLVLGSLKKTKPQMLWMRFIHVLLILCTKASTRRSES